MLDYAANAILHWPIETIRQVFAETCEPHGAPPDERLLDFRGEEPTSDSAAVTAHFWETVDTNLRPTPPAPT